MHGSRDLGGGKLAERAKKEGLALRLWQAVDGPQDAPHLLGVSERLVGGDVRGYQGLQEKVVGLIGLEATLAVESKIPGNADEPGAEVADGEEAVGLLEDADKGVLDGVFGFGAVAEEAVSDPEESGAIRLDKAGDVHRVRMSGAGGVERKRQCEFLKHVVGLL